MAKFHLPRMLHGMNSWKFFVEVVREEKYSRAPQSLKFYERHFFPVVTNDLEKFAKDFPLIVRGALTVVCRPIALLEIGRLGKIAVIFEDGELVEGVES